MSKDTQHSKSQPQLSTNHINAADSKQSSVPNLIVSVDPSTETDEKHSPRDAFKEDKKKRSFVDISKFMKVIKGHKDKDKDLSGDESEMPEVRRATRSDKEKEREGKELRRIEKEKEKERHREEKEAKKKTKHDGKDAPSATGPSVSFANATTSPRTAHQISDDVIKTAISRVQSFDVVSEEVTGSTISSMASEPEEYSTTKFIADNAKTKYSGGVTKVKLEEGQTEEDWEICKLADHTWAGQKRYHVPHGFGELRLMNGDLIYSGHWKEGKRHGQGAGTFKDGIYSGHWKSGQPDGEGTLTTDKFTFKGHWSKGQKDGYGNLERKNGFKYVGEWKADQKNGYGSVYWPDGAKYEGEWEADKREGYGICVYVDGERYTGNWNDHWRSGKGVSVYPNGNRYVGEWYKDMKQGKGTLFLSLDKKLYEGEWWRNKRHGHGEQSYLNGDRYIGDWILDKKDGEGTYFGADGSEYRGNWVNDKREGVGKLKYQNGDEYVGNWKEDMRNGSGAFIWKDYGKFVGEWKQDKISGPGEYYTFKNKKPLQGTFEEFQLIDNEGTYIGLSMLGKRWGRGKQEFTNKNVYNGEWKIGRMSGFGIMQYANGDVYEGFWLGGQRNGFGNFTYSDGRKYVGHWKRDKQEGRGTMTYPSGDLIDCTFTNGVSADFLNGILRYNNKQIYRGPLKNGCPHGIGSLYIPQVEFLEVPDLTLTMYRQWQEGNMLDGDGSFESNNGFVYEGEFVGLSCHGVGQLTYDDGSCYLGQWENDLMHGVGQFTSVEGDVYRGLWQRGQRHGWGVESYVDGGKFVGAWRLDNRHGCGVFQWPDGAFTLREYRQDDLVTERAISGEDVKTVLSRIPTSTFEQQIDNIVQAIREKQRDSSKHMLSMKKAVGEVPSKGTTPVVTRKTVPK